MRHRKTHLFQYGVIALPLAFAGLPIYVHAPALYAIELQIDLSTIGIILLLLRSIDAVADPIIGSVSDNYHHYRGAILALGVVLLAVGFWMVFHPLTNATLSWFALGITMCTMGYSIVSINIQTLGGLWHTASEERTRVTSWREAFGLLGLLLAAIAPSVLGEDQDPVLAFHRLSLLYIPLLLVTSAVFWFWMQHASIAKVGAPKLHTGITRLLRNKWNRQFFAIYLSNAIASAVPAVLVIFFVSDRIGTPKWIGLFLLLYFVSGASAMPLWQWLAQYLGKMQAWLVGMAVAVASFIWAFGLGNGDSLAYGVICVLSGFAVGADLALPPAIIADRIASQQHQSEASRYFSLLTFFSKAALALSTGIVLPVLGMLGYQPGQVTDYTQTIFLSYAYALAPSLMKAATALWLWRFIRATSIREPTL